MRIHQDDPTLILMSIPYGMSYDAGLHTLEQPRIRQWLKNYEKKQITLPTTEDRLEKERLITGYIGRGSGLAEARSPIIVV